MTNNTLTSDTTLGIKFLHRGYSRGDWVPRDVIKEVYKRISAQGKNFVWEYLVPEEEALSVADRLGDKFSSGLPLFGIPFSVKDNIHVEGMPTSASCPAYAHLPDETAPVVRQLLAAG
ncbi:MAG: allophanate hydrolase, partial [Flavobacteriales bacterium TMED191]